MSLPSRVAPQSLLHSKVLLGHVTSAVLHHHLIFLQVTGHVSDLETALHCCHRCSALHSTSPLPRNETSQKTSSMALIFHKIRKKKMLLTSISLYVESMKSLKLKKRKMRAPTIFFKLGKVKKKKNRTKHITSVFYIISP